MKEDWVIREYSGCVHSLCTTLQYTLSPQKHLCKKCKLISVNKKKMFLNLGTTFPNVQHLLHFYVVINYNAPHFSSSSKQIYRRVWLSLLRAQRILQTRGRLHTDPVAVLWRSQKSRIILSSCMTEGYKFPIPPLGLVHNPQTHTQTNHNSGWDWANQRDYQLKFSILKQFH